MSSQQTPEPTETIYMPGSSWGPPFLALGLTLLILGAYLWWPYAVAGGMFMLAAARSWGRLTADEVDDLPRRQDPVTDVVPPATK